MSEVEDRGYEAAKRLLSWNWQCLQSLHQRSDRLLIGIYNRSHYGLTLAHFITL